MHSVQTARPGVKFIGFPLEGFGLFTSFLLALATGFFTFFAATFLAIVTLLVWNGIGGHAVNYADSYLYVGMPAGLVALFLAFILFGGLWLRTKIR